MKTRVLSMLLSLTLLLSVFAVGGTVVTHSADYVPNILEYESYTSSKSFVITSYYGMVKFSQIGASSTLSGVTVSLLNDIDMSVGNYTPFKSFSGTFDGKGHALKSIKINESTGSAGVFATVNATGVVKNLGIEGGSIKLASASDSDRVGSIAGILRGTIERCYSTAAVTITASGTTNDLSVGGIAGASLNGGLIKDCYFAGIATGVDHASGICDWGQGHNEGYVGRLVNCYSIGELKATECYGLARYSGSTLESNYAAAITNCYYLSKYKDVSFTTNDVAIDYYMQASGYLAYLLDGGATASTRTRVWHQGELFPELSGDTKIGTYKLSLTFTSSSTAKETVYRNAGSTYFVDCVPVTLTSAGNVTNNVFTMPAANASLTVNTAVPNIIDYSANSTATEFIVVNAAGLTSLGTTVNAGTDTFANDKIYMLCDISMKSVSNHTPIGVYISDTDRSKSFQGSFYGNGNKVNALKVNKTSLNGGGLFGTLYKAKIYDLGIGGGYVTTANRAGGIAGYADASEMHQCYNMADITTLTGEDGAGGLAGVSRSTTKYYNCFNLGSVTATVDCAGGITGWGQTNVVLNSCYNRGKVSAGAGDLQGLTRHGGSLSTAPVAAYYYKASGASDYGASKSYNQFTTGSLAYSLNTVGKTANTGIFTATPLCPAICNTAVTASGPAVRVTVSCTDDSGDQLNAIKLYCNGGDALGSNAGGYGYAAATSATAPNKDGSVKITMNILTLKELNIGTAAELNSFMTAVNGGNSYQGYIVKLTADIDMSSYTCKPIGTESAPFRGVFDGNGHTVSGYNVASNGKYNAMFGVINGATVKNLFLGNSTVKGGYFSAALVGNNVNGRVINCGSDSDVEVYYESSAQEISVMSFNVRVNSDASPNSVPDRAPRVKQHIADYSPDIIGFQEVIPLWQTNFNSWLTGYSKEFVWRDSNKSEAAPLYWKTSKFTVLEQGTFWLSSTPDKMSKDWDAGCYRTCSYAALLHKSSGILVLAFNTHFDHQSTTARDNSATLMVSRMKAMEEKYKGKGYGDNIAIYCTGDYNCKPTSTAYKTMAASFADLRLDANTKHSTSSQATFHGWGDSASLIDFIFTNNHGSESLTYKVNNETINGKYISDHYALYGTFALNYMHAGGLVGYNSGLVADCFTTGQVIGGMNTGGLVGYNTGTVKNSYNGAALKSTDYMGGLIGVNDGTVSNCHYLTGSYTAYTNNTTAGSSMTEADIKTATFAATLSGSGNKWHYDADINGGFPFPAPLFINKGLIIKSSSAYLRNDTNYLLDVTEATDAATLTSNFENTNLSVYNLSGGAVADTAKIGTGYSIKLVVGSTVIDSVTVVIRGDLNGDGLISTTDYVICEPHILGKTELKGVYFAAGDTNSDGIISAADVLIIENRIAKG